MRWTTDYPIADVAKAASFVDSWIDSMVEVGGLLLYRMSSISSNLSSFHALFFSIYSYILGSSSSGMRYISIIFFTLRSESSVTS